jgi:hypothetical protein
VPHVIESSISRHAFQSLVKVFHCLILTTQGLYNSTLLLPNNQCNSHFEGMLWQRTKLNLNTSRLQNLCGLVVRVPEVWGSIPGATGFFWEVVGLEQGPLNFVSIHEELSEWKSRALVWKIEINGYEDPLRYHTMPFYPQKLALTSPTRGGRSAGIVRLQTKS